MIFKLHCKKKNVVITGSNKHCKTIYIVLNFVGDDEIKKRFRFRRATILAILSELSEFITRPTHRCYSMPPLIILCIALRFYACLGYYTLLGDYSGLSKASIHQCIKAVTAGLKEKAPKYIKFQSVESLPAIKQSFYEIAG